MVLLRGALCFPALGLDGKRLLILRVSENQIRCKIRRSSTIALHKAHAMQFVAWARSLVHSVSVNNAHAASKAAAR